MKSSFLFTLIFLSRIVVFGQSTPLYVCDTPSGSRVQAAMIPLGSYKGGHLCQYIYYQTDFPTMPPQGLITDVYWQVANLTLKGTKLKNLTVKMKHTGKSGFPLSYVQNNEIERGLTTVYYDSLYITLDTLYPGDWLRLTLPVPYPYSFTSPLSDSSKNLVVELSQDSTYDNWMSYFLNVYVDSNFSNEYRYLYRGKDTSVQPTNIARGYLLVLGFNPNPSTNVVETGVETMSLYPNPATDKLYLNNYSGVYMIYNVIGIKIAEGNLNKGESISVRDLPVGMYLMRIQGWVLKFMKE